MVVVGNSPDNISVELVEYLALLYYEILPSFSLRGMAWGQVIVDCANRNQEREYCVAIIKYNYTS